MWIKHKISPIHYWTLLMQTDFYYFSGIIAKIKNLLKLGSYLGFL
jgi:hypothetical protein